MPREELDLTDAARIAIRAVGLDRQRPGGAAGVLERLGAVQLDTIAVLARSHELVAYARTGAVGRASVERDYWGRGRAFEYWSHAACILPIETHPFFAFRRRAFARRPERWGADPGAVARVRAALQDAGPSTATDLGGARREAGWWRWSEAKDALEWLLAIGEVVVTERRAWRRVYDLADRVIPEHREPDWVEDEGVVGPSDAACVRELLLRSVRLLGIGTRDDIFDVHRLGGSGATTKRAGSALVAGAFAALLDAGDIVPVHVDGAEWYADPEALRRIPRKDAAHTVALSPFDPLVWYRPRVERLFGLRMRIEAYTPSHLRTTGYFAMPVLHEGAIVGYIDPAREASTLVARRVTLVQPGAEEAVAIALAEAARWVGSEHIRVEGAASQASARRIAAAANGALNAVEARGTRRAPRS